MVLTYHCCEICAHAYKTVEEALECEGLSVSENLLEKGTIFRVNEGSEKPEDEMLEKERFFVTREKSEIRRIGEEHLIEYRGDVLIYRFYKEEFKGSADEDIGRYTRFPNGNYIVSSDNQNLLDESGKIIGRRASEIYTRRLKAEPRFRNALEKIKDLAGWDLR